MKDVDAFRDAYERNGRNAQATADELGVPVTTLKSWPAYRQLRQEAREGHAPGHFNNGTAPGYLMGKVTVQRNRHGDVERTWERQSPDAGAMEAARQAMLEAFREDAPRLEAPEGPLDYQTDIIPWVIIGDGHIGLLCHEAEVNENFDLRIAASEICAGFGILIDELPDCERLVIEDCGDFTHYENMAGVTEASGHPLDYDGRFPKMIKAYSQIMRWMVDKALTKARHVDVIVNQGNHSRTNDIWMAELIRVAYGHTGRVHVLNNDSVFIGYRMGNTLVMCHHSDKCKPNRLAQVMMHDFREDFGETEHHYIDIGHIHHGMVMKEHPSVVIESFNHLAATDKWAFESGYRNRKTITVVKRSKRFGEVGRRILPIQEIRERLSGAKASPSCRRAYSV